MSLRSTSAGTSGSLRILQVVSSLSTEYGGPAQTVEAIRQVASHLGHVVRVFAADEQGAVRRFLGRPAYFPGFAGARTLNDQVRWCDLVHVHGLWTPANTLACRFARLRSRPLIVSPHGTLSLWALRQRRLKKIVYASLLERGNLSGASAIHCLTGTEMEEVHRFGIWTDAFVVANGVPVEALGRCASRCPIPARTTSPRLGSLDRGRRVASSAVPGTVVLFLGRIVPQKGVDRLILGFAEARRERPDLHLILAGPDEDGYKAEMKRLARDCGLNDAVTFTGRVEGSAKHALLNDSDVFALISRSEGDSVAVKEAFAVGLPAVITWPCVPGLLAGLGDRSHRTSEIAPSPEAAAEEIPAVVVDGDDPREVGQALVALARDPERRKDIGDRARTFARRHHSTWRMGERMLAAYATIVAGERGCRNTCV